MFIINDFTKIYYHDIIISTEIRLNKLLWKLVDLDELCEVSDD